MSDDTKDASTAPKAQRNNPLHGITLKMMLEGLVEEYGWGYLADRIDVRCFQFSPSIKSSLVFLRRTEWARMRVENLYLREMTDK